MPSKRPPEDDQQCNDRACQQHHKLRGRESHAPQYDANNRKGSVYEIGATSLEYVTTLALAELEHTSNPLWRDALLRVATAADYLRCLRIRSTDED